MGLTGPSLYNAFGNKQSLYRRALSHYLEQSVRKRIVRLEESLPPAEAIAALFTEIIDRSVADDQCKGCMLVNAAIELAPHDLEMRRLVAAELVLIEAFFRSCFQQASKADAEDLGRLLLSVLLGIRVLARTGAPRALLEGAARPALALLGINPFSAPRPARLSSPRVVTGAKRPRSPEQSRNRTPSRRRA